MARVLITHAPTIPAQKYMDRTIFVASGKVGKVKRNFSRVSEGVYIANMVIFMY